MREMKRHYVTLFDSRYLLRGLALYESLCEHTDNFVLYIIAFDDLCYRKLIDCNLKNAVIVSLDEFEDEELLSIKDSRSPGEYCWTSTAKSILYVFEHAHCDNCTYLDSDIYFFDNPEILIREVPCDKSVLITEHRYTPEYDQTLISGKYCVQFMYFKNDEKGLKVLNWWKDRCIEWCYAIPEDGKLGDQKYLDKWIELFEGVYELKHLGGGIAPWNVQQYTFEKQEGEIKFIYQNSGKWENVVFYHFHRLAFFDKDVVRLTAASYKLPGSSIGYIYKEYIRQCDILCEKYDLIEKRNIWRNEEKFLANEDWLKYSSNYFNYSFFL